MQNTQNNILNAADAMQSASSLLAVRIARNRKNPNEFVGFLQTEPFKGKVTFFEGDVQGLKEDEIAFVDGEVPKRFHSMKFAFVKLIGGKSFGPDLDDALAAVARELESGRQTEETTQEQLEQQIADEHRRENLWNRYLEVATTPGDTTALSQVTGEIEDGAVNPDGIDIGGILTPPEGTLVEVQHGNAYFYGPKYQVAIAMMELMSIDGAGWELQGFILSEEKLEVAMQRKP